MMRTLHFYRNVRRFLHDFPFYAYYFNLPGITAEISDTLFPNETIPKTHIPVPLTQTHSDEDRQALCERLKPGVLHCHHVSLLETVVHLGKKLRLPVAYTIYRKQLFSESLDTLFPERFFKDVRLACVPHGGLVEELRQRGYTGAVTVLSEVLSSSYQFRNSARESTVKTFAAFISEKNEPYIQNIHRSLEKILVTNHKLNIAWVCLDNACEKSIRADLSDRKISEYVSLIPLNDFPLLAYDGLVTDGNQNHCLTDSQYFHLLLSCLTQGKLLVTFPEKGMEDLLVDGTTCFIIPSQSPNKLSHLIHFLINFPDEIQALVQRAKEYTAQNFSMPVMQSRVLEAYQRLETPR